MQHALLGLAILLIAAIAAALAAPTFVDWNQWRAAFEHQATVIAGTPVKIRGRIDATILPTPAFVFRDVVIGDPQRSTGIEAGEVRGVLSLGALMRGAVEAEEFALTRPQMRLAIERGGKPVFPATAKASGPEPIAIAQISLWGGSLIVEDRASGGLLILDDISANGEIQARAGPMRVDASVRHNGRRWSVRANAARLADDGGGRVRITAERPDDQTAFETDGILTLAGAPRFEGKTSFARRGGVGMPWRVAGFMRAGGSRIELDALELTLGSEAAPIELAGNVVFVPEAGGRIDGKLSARRIDLDRAAGDAKTQSLERSTGPVREAIDWVNTLPFVGRIGIAVEMLVAGGGNVRELQADFGVRRDGLTVERLEAKLPGRASISANGQPRATSTFAGGVQLQAEDTAALVRWAFGAAAAAPLEDSGALRLAGHVDWSPENLSVERLDFGLGEARLEGRLAVRARDGRKEIDADLGAAGIDLDLLAPVADSVWAGAKDFDLKVALKGRALKLLETPLRSLDAVVARTASGLAVDHLAIDDFDGASLKARGRIAAPLARGKGNIDFEASAVRPGGLAALTKRLGGNEADALLRRLFERGRTVALAGSASGDGSRAISVRARGKVGEIETAVVAQLDSDNGTLGATELVLNARDAGALVALAGLTPGAQAPGDGRLELTTAAPRNGALPLRARLTVPGANLTGEGEIRFVGEARIEPRIELRLEATDLRPLLAAAARAGGERPVAAAGTARLVRTADALAFEDIALSIAGARTRGRLTVSAIEKPSLTGMFSIERTDLAHLVALAVGRASDADAFWPPVRFGSAPLAGVEGAIDLDVAALGLGGPLVATNARFRLRLGANESAVENFSSDLAGGKLTGEARFVRADSLNVDGRLNLQSFDTARLLAPGTWRAPLRGRGNMTLSFAGNGRTPAALAVSLAGQGTIALEQFELDRVDPSAVAEVMALPEGSEPRDELGVIASLSPALAKAPLKIDKLEAPIILAAGIARTGKSRVSVDAVDVTASGSVDLARFLVDAAIELEGAAYPGSTARPGAVVHWRGPLGAPERGIEAASLATAIALRAMERETRKLEERDRRAPPRPSDASKPSQPAEEKPPGAQVRTEPAIPEGPATAVPAVRPRERPATGTAAPPLPPPIDIRPWPGR